MGVRPLGFAICRCRAAASAASAAAGRPARRTCARRSISAPIIAGCWWRAGAGRRGFASSTRSRASCGWARGWPPAARCPSRRWRARSRRCKVCADKVARSAASTAPATSRPRHAAAPPTAPISSPASRANRHPDRDHLERRGGAARRRGLRAAARPARAPRPRLRYRRRLDRAGLARRVGATARRAMLDCVLGAAWRRHLDRPLWRARGHARRPTTRWSPRCARRSRRSTRAHGIAAAVAAGEVQMLGSSGTVTTLAGVHLDLPRYNRAQVDGIDAAASPTSPRRRAVLARA